jgi:DNA-directed RNA polymerase subunit RPC12/RpoP
MQETWECAGCGADLDENSEQFKCTGCDEQFCAGHLIKYDKEDACPMCAHWWADADRRKLIALYEERAMANAMRRRAS